MSPLHWAFIAVDDDCDRGVLMRAVVVVHRPIRHSVKVGSSAGMDDSLVDFVVSLFY